MKNPKTPRSLDGANECHHGNNRILLMPVLPSCLHGHENRALSSLIERHYKIGKANVSPISRSAMRSGVFCKADSKRSIGSRSGSKLRRKVW